MVLVTPDSDVKDRIDRPGHSDVLEAEYDLISGEDEDGEEEGHASFALNTPEPAAPKTARTRTPKDKQKKGRKAKAGSKSIHAAKFTIAAVASEGGASTAIAIEIDSKTFTLEQPDGIDLLDILFASGDNKPWDEGLTDTERAAMAKVIRTNNLEPVLKETGKMPGFVSYRQEANVVWIPFGKKAEPRVAFNREYDLAPQVVKMDATLNAATGIGSMIGMPSSLALLNARVNSGSGPAQTDCLGLAQHIAEQNQSVVKSEIGWTAKSQSRDTEFAQALDDLYTSLTAEILQNVTPYRKAVWAEKRLLQQQNSADITVRARELVPEQAYSHEFSPKIGIPGPV